MVVIDCLPVSLLSFFFLMIRRPPRSTLDRSSAASDVYKRQAYVAGLVSALAVVGVAVLGVLLTFAASWFLSRTMLRGEVSTFSLELPPYRPPRIWQTITTSFIDRTVYVLSLIHI